MSELNFLVCSACSWESWKRISWYFCRCIVRGRNSFSSQRRCIRQRSQILRVKFQSIIYYRFQMLILLIGLAHAFVPTNEKQQQQLQQLVLQEIKGGGNFQAVDPKPIINIDFIFSGYNLFVGNPLTWTETSDPGFTGRNLFAPTYASKGVTSDGRFKIPDHLNVITKKGCKYHFDSKTLRSVEQIQNHMSSFVGLNLISNFELTPWAFTASPEYNWMQQRIEKQQVTLAASSAACSIAQVTFMPELPELSNNFLDALKALPEEYSAPPYIEFLSTFGTHYLTEMTLGSRVGYVFTIPKEKMAKNAEEKKDKFDEDSLAHAAGITSAVLKGIITKQILPKKQDTVDFTDISEISTQSFVVEIGPQSAEKDAKSWLSESELEPVPIKFVLKSVAELVIDGKKQISQLKEHKKVGENLKKAQTDYCKLLSLQNQRHGQCENTKREITQWVATREVCVNFFESCDWQGPNTQVCGDRNPIQKVGADLPDIKANSLRFYSEHSLILGSVRFKLDKNLNVVIKAFHEAFLFLDKAEICLLNHGMLAVQEYPVYITNSQKCVVLLLWHSCQGEIQYFTAPICHSMDLADAKFEIIAKEGKCDVAILDVRYPNVAGLRICLFKESKMEGQSACFNNNQMEAFMGQEFKSMIIEESEVMVHRSIPGSMAVIFE